MSIANSQSLLKLMSIESSDAIQPSRTLLLCHPLLLLPSSFPTIRVFSNESDLRIRWPKYWSFGVNINPSNEYPGLISFRVDWLDLLAVQGTLKSLFQHRSSKASILRCSAFFLVQLSHPYVTTVKTTALTRWNFVGKGMSLLLHFRIQVKEKPHKACKFQCRWRDRYPFSGPKASTQKQHLHSAHLQWLKHIIYPSVKPMGPRYKILLKSEWFEL